MVELVRADLALGLPAATLGFLRIWDTATSQCLSSLGGQMGPIDWSQDGRLASRSRGGLVKIWDPASVPCDTQAENLHLSEVTSVIWSPDGSELASITPDGTVRVWDQSISQTFVVEQFISAAKLLVWSPDGKRLASGSRDIRIWDLTTGQSTFLSGHTRTVQSIDWSPSGSELASGSNDDTIIIWDLISGQQKILDSRSGWVTSVVWSPTGERLLATRLDDDTIRIWDLFTGRSIAFEFAEARRCSVFWSTDGSRLVPWSRSRTIRIWDSDWGATMRAGSQDHLLATE